MKIDVCSGDEIEARRPKNESVVLVALQARRRNVTVFFFGQMRRNQGARYAREGTASLPDRLRQRAEYGGVQPLRRYSFVMASHPRATPRMTAAYVDQVREHF